MNHLSALLGLAVLISTVCSSVNASNLFERYKYRANNGCYYYGYRPCTLSPLKPEYHTTTTNYHYTVNNFQPAAHQGNTVYGLSDLGFYGEVDFGAAFHQAGRLAEGAQRLSEKGTDGYLSMLQATSADRTQVASIIAAGQANAQTLAASKQASSSATIVQNIGGGSVGEMPAANEGGGLQIIEKACQRCHGPSTHMTLGGEVEIKFSEFDAPKARAAREYTTLLALEDNCAAKAKLTRDQQRELQEFLCKKSQ